MIGMSTKELETKRETIKRKIQELRINGDTKFVLENNGHKFEFKIIKVAGEPYRVFGGFGYSLRVFHKNIDPERIITEFDEALRGMDLSIKDCKFLCPQHFN